MLYSDSSVIIKATGSDKVKTIKKIAKMFIKTMLILGILAVISVFLINMYVTNTAEKRMYSEESVLPRDADCIIVLGAGLKADGTPNHMLRDRLDLAVNLYEAGICKKLLLTGDHGSDGYDEVNAMKDYVLSKGVPAEHVFLDHAGFSTYDSMYRARNIFCVEKAIVVTQKYHLYRAVYIGNGLGMDIYGISSDPYTYVGQAARNIREYLARVKDVFSVAFDVKPEYLGEKIDINTASSEATYG